MRILYISDNYSQEWRWCLISAEASLYTTIRFISRRYNFTDFSEMREKKPRRATRAEGKTLSCVVKKLRVFQKRVNQFPAESRRNVSLREELASTQKHRGNPATVNSYDTSRAPAETNVVYDDASRIYLLIFRDGGRCSRAIRPRAMSHKERRRGAPSKGALFREVHVRPKDEQASSQSNDDEGRRKRARTHTQVPQHEAASRLNLRSTSSRRRVS